MTSLIDQLNNLDYSTKLAVGIDLSDELLTWIKSITINSTHNDHRCDHDLELLSNYIDAVIQTTIEKNIKIIKWQSAFFEAYGSQGFELLQTKILYAKNLGLYNIFDGKRGDISSTMTAYGKACFDWFKADALTITPYIGEDTWLALKDWMINSSKAVFILWYSSNPTAGYMQTFNHLSIKFNLLEAILDYILASTDKHNITDYVGLVLGITQISNLSPSLIDKIKDLGLLLPGLGAQKGCEQDLTMLGNKNWHICPISRGLWKNTEFCQNNPNSPINNHSFINNTIDPFDSIKQIYRNSIDYYHKRLITTNNY